MADPAADPARPPPRPRAGFGKLIWLVGPLAVLAVAWQFWPHKPPERSFDRQRLQESGERTIDDMDRYAKPSDPDNPGEPATPRPTEPAGPQPTATPPHKPADPQ
jgi:hypothetical protein